MKAHRYFVMCMMFGTACVADDDDEVADLEAEVDSALTTPQLLGKWNYWFLGVPSGGFDVTQGGRCSPARERSHFTVERATGPGSCVSRGWASQDPSDCTAYIHIAAKPGEVGMCTTRVYENPANVVIFEHNDFQGVSKRFDPGFYNAGALGIGDNQLSSLKVPLGWTVFLYPDAGFQGWAETFITDANSVASFNDQTSSMWVIRGPGAPN